MSIQRHLHILRAPHLSEKSTLVAEYNQYVFKVSNDATKADIKVAIENLFKVKVRQVRVASMKPKQRRFGQIKGWRSGWKKAYVTLKEGQEIDILGAE